MTDELFDMDLLSKVKPSMTNNVEMDKFDSHQFSDLVKASPALQDLAKSSPIGNEPYNAMMQDIWAGYYKASPELTPEDKVDRLHKANRPFVEKFLEDSATQQARLTTRLDDLSSALATITTAETFNEELKSREELREARNKINQATEHYNHSRNEEGDQAMSEAEQELKNNAGSVRRAVRKAVEAGREKADQAESNLRGWGLEPGELKSVPLGERLNLVERLTSDTKMKRISDLVGRFRNLARARQKNKVRKNRDEIHSITLGNNLGHVLPQELAGLRHPVLKLDFYRKYQERSLLQYDLKTNEPQGKGPMVVLVDCSGSMGGQPMEWASATALALVDTAARQKRRAAVIFFNAQIVKEVEFAPGEKDINKFMDVATTGASGGTKYEPALLRAEELIVSVGYKNADIVMITDGECSLDTGFLIAFNNSKQVRNFRCHCVLLGAGGNELRKWCDRVWQVNTLDDETAGDLFEEVG